MRQLLRVTGGLAIVMLAFWGTLFVLSSLEFMNKNNQLRVKHIRLLADALEMHRQALTQYPLVADDPVDVLKRDLVDRKFLAAIPSDPARAATGRQYRYAGGGNSYGILVTLEPEPSLFGLTGTKPGFTCLTGVKIRGSGAWGDPPACPF